MKVITAGQPYMDIDAYAGCIAYAELLRLQGFDAHAVTTSNINESVTKTIRDWGGQISHQYSPSSDDTFTIIDISDPDYFDPVVKIDSVEEVIDHHPGFEEFWMQKIGEKTQIEQIGAACTMIFERWEQAGLLDSISETSARLLICGILDNTLDFNASITTDRDRNAYERLLAYANLPSNWSAKYFTECAEAIFNDFTNALRDDTKTLKFRTNTNTLAVGQIVVWDGSSAIEKYANEIEATLSTLNENWFINIISIGEKASHFYATNPEIQSWLESLLDITFENSVATANRLWLRKEILKRDIELADTRS